MLWILIRILIMEIGVIPLFCGTGVPLSELINPCSEAERTKSKLDCEL